MRKMTNSNGNQQTTETSVKRHIRPTSKRLEHESTKRKKQKKTIHKKKFKNMDSLTFASSFGISDEIIDFKKLPVKTMNLINYFDKNNFELKGRN